MKKTTFQFGFVLLCFLISLSLYSQTDKMKKDRAYWVDMLCKLSEPVLYNMSKGELKKNMAVELSPTWDGRTKNVTYMEAFGRLMAGVAPWLALPDDETSEGKRRKQMREWALLSYANAVNPDSPDYLQWTGSSQVLVDAAYIANSFIRAPKALWEPLDQVTKDRYVKEFKSLRTIKPAYNNWLLFRGMVEVFLLSIGEDYDGFALDVAIRKMNEWYLGDGWYGDGPEFSLDYYNGYVIHPMLVEIVEIAEQKKKPSVISLDLALRRMQRYNELIERLISPEGTFPAVGRSMTYRMGAFQTLALSAWKYGLPESMSEGQVRSALTAVMKRMFSMEGNFNKEGFLQLGFVGHQTNLADYYTNNGSLYITSLVFLPLGLSADHSFWTSPAQEWTSQKAWGGKAFPKDYHQSIAK
ncbi:DUF2264 domain-containing protein [Dysgonomonas sp. BGC7]|uniref:DUF2264 domain-containing protein n=2 Tax=Dysgonomonas sp. BGC7 TaxID=1658008 RepID=UPI0006823EC3|nr:DUF2264 domain-containing protein [Dysgonomonas sp. BGC7]